MRVFYVDEIDIWFSMSFLRHSMFDCILDGNPAIWQPWVVLIDQKGFPN